MDACKYATMVIGQMKMNVESGVPQGTHVDPILFNICIHKIGDNLRSEYLLFAYDLKIYVGLTSKQNIDTLQKYIHGLEQWCLVNKLSLI